jgi:hypothetical protein
MSSASVRSQRTPNPNAMKFTLDRPVLEGTTSKTFGSPQAAVGNALAERLFAITGVTNVFMVADFVTVTKAESADWGELTPRIIAVLEESFA